MALAGRELHVGPWQLPAHRHVASSLGSADVWPGGVGHCASLRAHCGEVVVVCVGLIANPAVMFAWFGAVRNVCRCWSAAETGWAVLPLLSSHWQPAGHASSQALLTKQGDLGCSAAVSSELSDSDRAVCGCCLFEAVDNQHVARMWRV